MTFLWVLNGQLFLHGNNTDFDIIWDTFVFGLAVNLHPSLPVNLEYNLVSNDVLRHIFQKFSNLN